VSEHKWLTEKQVQMTTGVFFALTDPLQMVRLLVADRREMRKLLDRVTATNLGEADSIWQDINDMLEATRR